MKKLISTILCVILVCSSLMACTASQGVSQEDYDKVVGENTELQSKIVTLENQVKALTIGDNSKGDTVDNETKDEKSSEDTKGNPTSEETVTSEPTTSTPPASSKDTTKPTPTQTIGQLNALSKAKSYLDVMPFSYSGLIKQLEYEKYSTSDATYAADNCGANWNEQAAKKAKSYLELMSFSREGLIEQLEYEGYTHEQAVYGTTAAGY